LSQPLKAKRAVIRKRDTKDREEIPETVLLFMTTLFILHPGDLKPPVV
jgi:hypothetical protein